MHTNDSRRAPTATHRSTNAPRPAAARGGSNEILVIRTVSRGGVGPHSIRDSQRTVTFSIEPRGGRGAGWMVGWTVGRRPSGVASPVGGAGARGEHGRSVAPDAAYGREVRPTGAGTACSGGMRGDA